MANVNNDEISRRIIEDTKISVSEGVPNKLADQIVPVLISNPREKIQNKVGTTSDAASGTIFTTSAVKDTFLIGCSLSVAKSALSDSTVSSIFFTPEASNVTSAGLNIRYEPTTAGSFTESISFPKPIKLKKGTAVNVTNSTATASIDAMGSIFFYEVDSQ